MSLLDRVRYCQRWDPDAYRPFVIAGRRPVISNARRKPPSPFREAGDQLGLQGAGN